MPIRRAIFPFWAMMVWLLGLGILGGCSLLPSAGAPTPTQNQTSLPSLTPFLPSTSSPTPETLTLWISPSLPEALRAELLALDQVDGELIEVVSQPEAAQVRAEPDAETPLATWIYALVAPFPTVEDELGLEALAAQWGGESEGALMVSAEDVEALQALLGPYDPGRITIADGSSLLAQAWEKPDARAIVPFEALEPRWKVLSIDGMSPVHMGFAVDDYALAVHFGLSGETAAVEALRQNLNWPASNLDPEHMTVLLMTGVTALTRATAYMMDAYGVLYPADLIGDWLRQADFTHISNEVSFTESCPDPDPNQTLLRFCAHPRHLPLLDEIEVDLVELTGNHVNDAGTEPMLTTLGFFRERGWQYFGGGEDLEDSFKPALIEHNGNRLAFLGCNQAGPHWAWALEDRPGATPCDMERLLPEVTRLRDEGYLVIFTFQWKEIYTSYPEADMTEAFREAADAGAVIVNGSQAHQPKGFEFYNGSFIHYGLGNLFFDQMWALHVRQEFLDRHVFYEGRHISTVLMTAMLEDWVQPRPMTADERIEFLTAIFEASGW